MNIIELYTWSMENLGWNWENCVLPDARELHEKPLMVDAVSDISLFPVYEMRQRIRACRDNRWGGRKRAEKFAILALRNF